MVDFKREAQVLQPRIVTWRRWLHQHPELGLDLPQTADYVCRELRSLGYKPQEICQSGIVAVLEGAKPGKTLLLRADMDALPIEEDTNLAFTSQHPGISHACGHDAHTAMLLGAAKLLMEHRDQICGRVKFMFQPGEEGAGGAKKMVDAGVLESPRVDAAMGLHQVLTRHNVPSGTLCYTRGAAMASCDMFKITVYGKGCHGAAPELGVSPIHILCSIYSALQTIEFCEKKREDPLALSVGQISAGKAGNAIPDEGFLCGSIRCYGEEVRALAKRRVNEIAQGVATTLGGRAVVDFVVELPATISDFAVGDEMFAYAGEVLGGEQTARIERVMGSEDFSEVLCRVPGVYFRLSMGSWEEGYRINSHNPKVMFDEDAMPNGAAVLAHCAVRWLENHAGT